MAMTISTRWFWRKGLAGAAMVALGALPLVSSCTSTQTEGTASSYLIISSLSAASGAKPTDFAAVLASDVLTLVKKTDDTGATVFVPTIFEDAGQVTFRLGLKDPGSASSPSSPTTSNFITVTRYHVDFVRADGRNTPGVDVPFPFDGGMTVTVGGSAATAGFSIVRLQAKLEAPLKALAGFGAADVISTVAKVTFYGTDQAGRPVSVTGNISVNFSDWGDPQ
jgi:hypothetical protein